MGDLGPNNKKLPDFAQETRVGSLSSKEPEGDGEQVMGGRGDAIPPLIQVLFKVDNRKGKILVFEMDRPSVILGRVQDVADVVVDDGLASRYHASVIHESGNFILSDMDSTNGTFLNEIPVGRVELKNGDVIRIGNTTVVFEVKPR
ncbi:FHA domain-containing protein [Myxococcota bacterium]|nr:FHA domain-containing protein [Myxococcota bacterium]